MLPLSSTQGYASQFSETHARPDLPKTIVFPVSSALCTSSTIATTSTPSRVKIAAMPALNNSSISVTTTISSLSTSETTATLVSPTPTPTAMTCPLSIFETKNPEVKEPHRLTIPIFYHAVFKHLREINDTNERLKRASPQPFEDQGIWYGSDHFERMKECRDSRLTTFIENANFINGYANPAAFIQKDSSPYTFDLAPNATPSQAVEQLKNGLSYLDCGAVCKFAVILALKDVWSEPTFDAVFGHKSIRPLKLSNYENSSVDDFMQLEEIASEGDLRLGDLCYISNIPQYRKIHFYGMSQGFNVFYTGPTKKYLGFGLPNGGLTCEEIEDHLRSACNLPPSKLQDELLGEIDAERLKKITEKLKKLTKREFKKIPPSDPHIPEKKLIKYVMRIDFELIASIKEASIENAQKIYAAEYVKTH